MSEVVMICMRKYAKNEDKRGVIVTFCQKTTVQRYKTLAMRPNKIFYKMIKYLKIHLYLTDC